MVSKVFVLGRTGSGKSTTIQFLVDTVQQYGWSTYRFDDSCILREMFNADKERQQFMPTEHSGFEVIDPGVFDVALRKLEQEIQDKELEDDRRLILIEFSRNNYRDALELFSSQFLRDAHFLFISADLRTCLERICERGIDMFTKDNFFVRDTVLFHHFSCPYMPPYIRREKVMFLHNMGTLGVLKEHVIELAPQLINSATPEPLSFSLSLPQSRLVSDPRSRD